MAWLRELFGSFGRVLGGYWADGGKKREREEGEEGEQGGSATATLGASKRRRRYKEDY